MNNNKKRARIAGLLFLVLVICGVFAEFFVRQKIFIHGDPVATADNIKRFESLFRLGIVSDLVMTSAFFFFPLILYPLFKPVDKGQAQLMVLCVMISVSVLCINMINQVAALLLMSGAEYLSAFSQKQLQGLMSFFLHLHHNGYMVAQIFFGLYLFPLGYLVYKSGFLPKIIGIFLMIGCFGDMIDFLRFFLIPDYESVILDYVAIPADIGEFSFFLWLIIKGVKTENPVLEKELVA